MRNAYVAAKNLHDNNSSKHVSKTSLRQMKEEQIKSKNESDCNQRTECLKDT